MPNLLTNIPQNLPTELFERLVSTGAIHIERIVSKGHASPAEGWYDQDHNEWVAVIRGAARLAFEDGREVNMGPGDWIEIPARCQHRVAWTDPDVETVWLAVHYP